MSSGMWTVFLSLARGGVGEFLDQSPRGKFIYIGVASTFTRVCGAR